MSKDDWARVLMHLPWGALAAWIFFGCPLPYLLPIDAAAASKLAGSLVFLGECFYEVMNDWRKKDHSFVDVLGIVWGFTAGAVGFIIGGGL